MDLLTFIAAIVGHLAWPASAIILGFSLREPLTALLLELRTLRFKGLELEFRKKLAAVEADLDAAQSKPLDVAKKIPELQAARPLPKTHQELIERIAELSPSAAVLESWRNVEATLKLYFSIRGIPMPKSGQEILGHLDYDPNFNPKLLSAYQELRVLRNRAAHDHQGITESDAREFNDLADRLKFALIQAIEGGPH